MSDTPIFDSLNTQGKPVDKKALLDELHRNLFGGYADTDSIGVNTTTGEVFDVNSLYPGNKIEVIDMTPDKVISSRTVRLSIGIVLWVLSLFAAVAALFLGFFPEFNDEQQVAIRAIAFTNGLVSLLSGLFGLIVTRPNVPAPTR